MTGFVVVTDHQDTGPDVALVGLDPHTEIIHLSSYPTTRECPRDEVDGFLAHVLQLLDRTDLPGAVRYEVQKVHDGIKERFSVAEWDAVVADARLLMLQTTNP